MKKRSTILIALVLLTSFAKAQKFEGLALTPPMGWNSWNKFASHVDEATIRNIADEMVSSGLRDAGYIYVNIDDCWQGSRDSLGFITANPVKFPSGIKALADYVHSKGLKLGIYSDAGYKTCGGFSGSLGHEYQDALMYARWGIDYLKYDWCETQNVDPKGAYNLMRDALHAAGRPILFSMCEWGHSKPWTWAKNTGHSWRTTGDIIDRFDGIDDHGKGWVGFGVLQILDMQKGLRKYAGPGHWNDPDMLEVGNGMTVNQDRAHFSLWCMLSAPLILGNDIGNMSADTKAIIENKDLIAINQDQLGVQGLRYRAKDGIEVWFKPLYNGDWAMCILNRNKAPKRFAIQWQQYNLTDNVSGRSTHFGNTTYTIKNLWTTTDEGDTHLSKHITIPAQDVVVYRLQANKK